MADSPAPFRPPSPAAALTRRSLLRGAAALGAVGALGGLGLAACGQDGEATDVGRGDDEVIGTKWSLLTLLNPLASLEVGTLARLPLGLGDERGSPIPDAPDELVFQIRTVEGVPVAGDIVVPAHAAGLPFAYFPLTFTPEAAGNYTATTEVEGQPLETSFTVPPAAEIVIPRPGQPFPSATTPTVEAPAGVDPICTRQPICPLHEVDLATVLGTEPLAVLVSTPAFCQQAICGPVLDVLIDGLTAQPGVRGIHVEVFASAAEVESAGHEADLAPAVDSWMMPFEPCLFLVSADGTLSRRVDVIFDEAELADALAEIAV